MQHKSLKYTSVGLAMIILLATACSGGDDLLYSSTPQVVETKTFAEEASSTATTRPATSTPEATITPSHTPEGLPELITDEYGVPMALVPAGPFEMGSDADDGLAECKKLRSNPDKCKRKWYLDEEPVHTVKLDDFYIDLYEVTNIRYARCVDAGECSPPSSRNSDSRDSYYGETQFDNFPVIRVSWNNANTYCEWRGARLPTEAEWEKAARGGPDGKVYPWGDEFDGSLANFCDSNCPHDWANSDFDDGYADTAPVGSYPPNGYGLYDMAGNVWEWVANWYNVYPDGDLDASYNFGETYRALRGGSWHVEGYILRVADRIFSDPSGSNYNFGFRCARAATP